MIRDTDPLRSQNLKTTIAFLACAAALARVWEFSCILPRMQVPRLTRHAG
jgi:hypothetical protein